MGDLIAHIQKAFDIKRWKDDMSDELMEEWKEHRKAHPHEGFEAGQQWWIVEKAQAAIFWLPGTLSRLTSVGCN